MQIVDRVLWQRSALTAVVAAAGCWLVPTAAPMLAAHWSAASARQDVKDWSAQQSQWTTEEWDSAREALSTGLSFTPLDASLHESMALLYSVRGTAEWGDGDAASPGTKWFKQAVQEQAAVTRLKPLHPYGWATLAAYRYGADDPAAAIFGDLQKAIVLGPNEREMNQTLLRVVQVSWPAAPAPVRDWAEKFSPGSIERFEQETREAEAAYAKAEEAARAASEAAANAAALEQAAREAQQRAAQNAASPAFRSYIDTPGAVTLPK